MWVSSILPRCSQDPEAGKMLAKLFTNRKETIPHEFSEDCLYLNIYTPADLTKSSRLPVNMEPLVQTCEVQHWTLLCHWERMWASGGKDITVQA